MRIKIARRIVVSEVTMTSNPADPNAAVRQHKEADVPKDVQDQEGRAALIQRVRAAHNLPEDWATRMGAAEDELSDDEIRQSGRDEAAAIRAAKPAPVQIRTAAPANDDPAVTRTRQAEALACRMSGAAPSDAARPFMGWGLHDHARERLGATGVPTRGLGAEELLIRAHGTTDFPELLTGAGNRVLAQAYQVAQSPLKTFARQTTAPDFRAKSILKIGEFTGLQKVSEHGEIKAMTTSEVKEGYSLETFGGSFAWTRKAQTNDDLGA